MSLTKVSYSMIEGATANVLDYGADVTGVADSTAAFQSAIDSGMAVYVPKGNYLITATLNLPQQCRIFGDGRVQSVINFKPLVDDILFVGPAPANGCTLLDMTFIGTDYQFDPNKTPLIKSSFFRSDYGVRLLWDRIHVLGFNADEVIRVTQSIETYIYRSFFIGPYYDSADPVGTTTTRTSSCFLFNTPWNTTTHLMDCFIQAFKYGVQFVNGFSNRLERCTLENNFIAVVSRKAGGTGSGLMNTVKNCYFEDNKYSLGGAGLAADFTDINNTSLYAFLYFEDCYFHASPITGGNSQADSPNFTYGTVRSLTTIAMRAMHTTFLSSQTGWSHIAGQFDSYLDTSTASNTNGTTGCQIGFERNINNNGFDKQFRLIGKTPVNVANHSSIGFIANTTYDGSNPTSDVWDPAGEVWRFRVQGGNAYLSGGGAYNTSGADYAEMFEWVDGNPDVEDRVGRLVYLNGDKVTLTANGTPIGVVSATASVIGNNWSEQWAGRLLRDDYGRDVLDEKGSPVVNPDFDPEQQYTPRHDRKEWAVIGLVGRLRVRSGEPVPDSWIKLRDISSTVAEYLTK